MKQLASCDYYIELLSAGLDGQLSPGQEQELAEHLLECPYCREIGPQLAAAHAAFADLEEIPAPQGFAEGVMKEIRARDKGAKVVPLFKRPVWKAVTGLAACCVLCFGLYQSGMLGQNRVESDTMVYPVPAQERSAAAEVTEGNVVYVPEGARADDREVTGIGSVTTIGVTYGSTPEAPMACVLDSGAALEGFLEQFPEDAHLDKVAQSYPEDYFGTGRLLAVVLEDTSGLITHQMISATPEQVTLLRRVPEECTDDMAAWLILAEVGDEFRSGNMPSVVLETE